MFDDKFLEERQTYNPPRDGDYRNQYERDKARIIHSAAFRRLQGKTQVMGVGEGDFHRTRLTHSIEAGQIGEGLLLTLRHRHRNDADILRWLPSDPLMIAACYAHDLGHPPYGHGGEKALHQCMIGSGGFEGNGQTLRILAKLEKYQQHKGINPTRRTVLSVLKYPVPYKDFDESKYQDHPPKCYFDTEKNVVDWALSPFPKHDLVNFSLRAPSGKPAHRILDASIMECADDIAYGVHDLEDIVARDLITRRNIEDSLEELFGGHKTVGSDGKVISKDDVLKGLFDGPTAQRKSFISSLVNTFVTEVRIKILDSFEHPLMRYRISLPDEYEEFLERLKKLTFKLVIKQASVQQLERRGQRVVEALFCEFNRHPTDLIPQHAWDGFDGKDSKERRVCDYIAGMTDSFAEKIYHRLFTPGFGSSRDEL